MKGGQRSYNNDNTSILLLLDPNPLQACTILLGAAHRQSEETDARLLQERLLGTDCRHNLIRIAVL
jgi:hypothetical protein